MSDLSDFQRGKIVEGRLAGLSVTETSRQLVVSRGDEIFQDDNVRIHVEGLVRSWFDEPEDEVKHLPGLHNHPTSI
ncbi:hypothetical protein TNCV_1209351 [Trichonephila clavipes]|nr:hypothetical protein TNCV_1209351 [Trichonephila clavipes]